MYQDHLGLVKKLLSKVPDDEFSSVNARLPELNGTEFDFRTLKLPLEKDDFDYELEDDLFDSFSSLNQGVDTRSLFRNYKHKRTFIFNHLNKRPYSGSDFTFSLRLIRKTQSVKNEAKIILGLLNVLFWFDLAILQLHTIFSYFCNYLLAQINQTLDFLNRLKKLKKSLYARLKLRKQNSQVAPQI